MFMQVAVMNKKPTTQEKVLATKIVFPNLWIYHVALHMVSSLTAVFVKHGFVTIIWGYRPRCCEILLLGCSVLLVKAHNTVT